MRLADVEHKNVVAAVEPLLQFFHLDFVCSHFGWRLLTANSAEFFIVNQLGDCRIFAAGRAIGVLAQLELTELHAERVDQQQAPDKRVTGAENQLNGFRSLNDSDEPGQNSENSTFGAGRN